jgi:hypothetical protein
MALSCISVTVRLLHHAPSNTPADHSFTRTVAERFTVVTSPQSNETYDIVTCPGFRDK